MKRIVLFLLPLFLISCSQSKMLLKSLNNYQAPLNYLYDSKKQDGSKPVTTIAVERFDNNALDSVTSVAKINHKILPFIIYTYTELNFSVKLGQSSLDENYAGFFTKSFAEESQRTGCYALTENIDQSEYTIEFALDSCSVNSKYQRNTTVLFFLFAYSMYFQEIGSPAQTDLVMNVKLKKKGELVFEKKYSIHKIQPFITRKTLTIDALRADFITNMAESLSLSTKDCIESIIADINQSIK